MEKIGVRKMIHSNYTLEDTIPYMLSNDYKDRFMAEYWQTQIRYEKLHSLVIKAEAGTLTFEPFCSIEVLKKQEANMGMYLYQLGVRAEIENINVYDMKASEE